MEKRGLVESRGGKGEGMDKGRWEEEGREKEEKEGGREGRRFGPPWEFPGYATDWL
jgi:hypothetical protein